MSSWYCSFAAYQFTPTDRSSIHYSDSAIYDGNWGTSLQLPISCSQPVYFQKWRLQRNTDFLRAVYVDISAQRDMDYSEFAKHDIVHTSYSDNGPSLSLRRCDLLSEDAANKTKSFECPCRGAGCDLYLYHKANDYSYDHPFFIVELHFY